MASAATPKMMPMRIGVPDPAAMPADIQISETNVAMIAAISVRCADHPGAGAATTRRVVAGREGFGVAEAWGGNGTGSGWLIAARIFCLSRPLSESDAMQGV